MEEEGGELLACVPEMLDLGLSFFSAADELPDASSNRMDESGASNSSVVNADVADDESCSTRFGGSDDVCELSLEVLRGRGKEEQVVVETMELFPVKGGGDESCVGDCSCGGTVEEKGGGGGGGSLSVVKGNEEGYVKVQRVKRSRRGPKSKSSQYRGVTFYRRTGRWESHIW